MQDEPTTPGGGLLDDHWDEATTAAQLGKTPRTLQSWRAQGIGPPPSFIGKTVYYRISAAKAWLSARERPMVREGRQRRRLGASQLGAP